MNEPSKKRPLQGSPFLCVFSKDPRTHIRRPKLAVTENKIWFFAEDNFFEIAAAEKSVPPDTFNAVGNRYARKLFAAEKGFVSDFFNAVRQNDLRKTVAEFKRRISNARDTSGKIMLLRAPQLQKV